MKERTPVEWALRPLKHYAEFSGRAPRAEYWWYSLAAAIAGFLIDWFEGKLSLPKFGLYGPLSLGLTLMLAVPGIAVNVRRLHDIDRSGWWVLIVIGWYPMSMLFGLDILNESSIEQVDLIPLIFAFLALFAGAIVMLIFTVTQGDEGPNRYGPDPYGSDSRD